MTPNPKFWTCARTASPVTSLPTAVTDRFPAASLQSRPPALGLGIGDASASARWHLPPLRLEFEIPAGGEKLPSVPDRVRF